MAAEWTGLCAAPDLTVADPHIDVQFVDERRHQVTVADDGDAYLLRAFVARKTVVAKSEGLAVQTWLRNRSTALVGFRIDHRERLVGEAWLPKVGLKAEEFQLAVRTVAIECDRFEYLLTGRDVE